MINMEPEVTSEISVHDNVNIRAHVWKGPKFATCQLLRGLCTVLGEAHIRHEPGLQLAWSWVA